MPVVIPEPKNLLAQRLVALEQREGAIRQCAALPAQLEHVEDAIGPERRGDAGRQCEGGEREEKPALGSRSRARSVSSQDFRNPSMRHRRQPLPADVEAVNVISVKHSAIRLVTVKEHYFRRRQVQIPATEYFYKNFSKMPFDY
jgi:hypothetical protein